MVPRILLLATISMFTYGCMTPPHDPNRPPKRPEEFRVPPDQDARFAKPVD